VKILHRWKLNYFIWSL